MNCQLKFTIRLYGEDKFFGPGIANLLRAVEVHHSLRSAAISMNMAYSKAWKIIRQAEQELGFKLLDTTTGGRGGGGAALTPQAAALLESYTAYCARVESFGQEIFPQFFPQFLD